MIALVPERYIFCADACGSIPSDVLILKLAYPAIILGDQIGIKSIEFVNFGEKPISRRVLLLIASLKSVFLTVISILLLELGTGLS